MGDNWEAVCKTFEEITKDWVDFSKNQLLIESINKNNWKDM